MSDETRDAGRPVKSTRTRRRFLTFAAAGIAGAAGCLDTETTSTPTDADDDAGTVTDSQGDGDDTETDGRDGNTPVSGTMTDQSLVGRPVEEWPAYDPDWAAPTTSPLESDLEVEVLVENLEIPWDLSFAPDGTLFITERVGRVLQFDGDEVRTIAEPHGAIDAGSIEPGSDERPWWVDGGEGGTLGIEVHPAYPDPPEVFVYYTYVHGGEKYNRVDAFDVESDDPAAPVRTLVDEIPADSYHNGGRLEFGPRNYLWVTCGDGGQPASPQDLSSLGGKILRMTPEGDAAPDNPDLGSDADSRIYTYGHRNPQGVVWLPDGTPVCSEHGETGDDEINRLVAGENYGWNTEEKRIREREDYPGSGMQKPLYNTANNSFAPTGSLFYTGESIPALQNRMLTGGLISQQLVVTTLTPEGAELPPADDAHDQVADAEWADSAYAATVHTMFEDELGRVRHVEQGPEGEIYVCTSNRDGRAQEGFPREIDDVLVRIRPA